MVPKTISQTGTGTTAWYPVDFARNPFNASVSVVVTGTVTYDVEHTFDNVFDTTITPTAFKHATLVSQTANGNSNYAFPIRAVRLNVTAGTGSAALTWMQGSTS
jgi:hypothetical protein